MTAGVAERPEVRVVRIPPPSEQEMNRIRREAGLVRKSTVAPRATGRDTTEVWLFPVSTAGRSRKEGPRRRPRPRRCFVERG